MARCRDCSLYDIDAAKNKSGFVLKNRIAKCLWKSKEVWPDSVFLGNRPIAGSMRPDDGARCKRFIKREEK